MVKKVFKTSKEKWVFKMGEIFHLDCIYHVQGIGGSDWWEHIDDDGYRDDTGDSDTVRVIRDISFTISIKKQIFDNEIKNDR